VEELEPVVEEQVERLARKINPDVEILGKGDYIPRDGELDFLAIRNALSRMQGLAQTPPCAFLLRRRSCHPGRLHSVRAAAIAPLTTP